jgi:hypothetical protein
LPCATKLCCFVDIAVIVAAARGEEKAASIINAILQSCIVFILL